MNAGTSATAGRDRRRRTAAWVAGLGVLSTVGVVSAGLVARPPRVDAATEVRLVAAGDFGARRNLRRAHSHGGGGPDAALALGDLAYLDRTPETAWCAYVKQHVGEGFPFQLISGNHESLDVNDGQINDFSACLPNQVPGIVGHLRPRVLHGPPRASPTPLVRVINTSPT